jgi:predicted nucleotidyltransferase
VLFEGFYQFPFSKKSRDFGRGLVLQSFSSPSAWRENSSFPSLLSWDRVKDVKTIPQGMLDKAVERLKAEFQPEEIYLFGSHAWGIPTDDSDVDLMVIVRESSEKAIRRMQRAHRCLSGLGFSKDVLVPTRAQVDRYKHLRASLFHQVLAKGRKLYG